MKAMTHYTMLQRNLLYTGVTRAKKALVLVGQKKAVGCCVKNVTVDRRNTLLASVLTPQPSWGICSFGKCLFPSLRLPQ